MLIKTQFKTTNLVHYRRQRLEFLPDRERERDAFVVRPPAAAELQVRWSGTVRRWSNRRSAIRHTNAIRTC